MFVSSNWLLKQSVFDTGIYRLPVFPLLVVAALLLSWWRHQMETFSALLAICAENSPVPGEFPTQRPVTRSFDVFFDLRLNKRLSKQSWGWWFETLSCPFWRHRNVVKPLTIDIIFLRLLSYALMNIQRRFFGLRIANFTVLLRNWRNWIV